jgi:hypothetical protein
MFAKIARSTARVATRQYTSTPAVQNISASELTSVLEERMTQYGKEATVSYKSRPHIIKTTYLFLISHSPSATTISNIFSIFNLFIPTTPCCCTCIVFLVQTISCSMSPPFCKYPKIFKQQ